MYVFIFILFMFSVSAYTEYKEYVNITNPSSSTSKVKLGYIFQVTNTSLFLYSEKSGASTASTAYLYQGNGTSGTLLGAAGYVGNIANFTSLQLPLIAGNYYTIVSDNGGATYGINFAAGGQTYPRVRNTLNWVGRWSGESIDTAGINTVSFIAVNVAQNPFNYFYVRAQDATNNTFLNNFTVTLENGTSYTNTTSFVYLPINDSRNVNLTVSLDGYIDAPYTNYNTSTFLTAELFRDNSINLFFYDETTLNPITGVNYSVYTVNNVGFGIVQNLSTNSSVAIEGLPTNLYVISYSKTNYTTRNYVIDIPVSDTLSTNLSLYLLPSSVSSTFVATVTDTNNRPIPSVYGSLLRRYVVNGQTTYETVEMFIPSVSLSGSAPFTAVPNTVAYLFRVQDFEGNVLYQAAAENLQGYETLYLIDTQVFLKVRLSGNSFDIYQELNGFSYSLTNSTSTTFWLSWSDTLNAITQMCLEVKANNSDVISNQCSTSDGGILSYVVPASNSTYYVARAKVIPTSGYNQITIDFKTLNYDVLKKSTSTLFGYLGIFILVLTLMVSAVALAQNPPIAIMVTVLSVLAFGPTALGLVYIGPILQGTVFVVGIILAYISGGDK